MNGWRSSAAYRIAFLYAAAFALTTLLLGAAVYLAADAEFRRQRDRAIVEEAARVAAIGDLVAVAKHIAQRSGVRGQDAYLYALFDAKGGRVAGSLDTTAPSPGQSDVVFHDSDEGNDVARAQTLSLAGGYRLTVAVDAEPIERIDATILALFGLAFIVILAVGIVGALVLGGYLRRRLGAITATANAIVGGDFSRRVPVSRRVDEFDQVGAALNAMLDRTAQLMENLRQVSSDVAHDLRTPLMRLRHQLEHVGTVEGAAERAIEQGDALLALFAAILRIAEVEAGTRSVVQSSVDLSALATDIVESYLPALTDSGHVLEWLVTPAIAVMGDRELLAQALVNLLDNARIHTPPGTKVIVTLILEGRRVNLTVSDDGPGVAARDQTRILERFVRGETSRTTPGNGLGLSLVRAIASAHNADVIVENCAPGLRITLSLPRSAR